MAKETDVGRVVREVERVPAVRDAGILLLQEVTSPSGEGQGMAARLGAALGRRVAYAAAAPEVCDQGLAILSRYPLTDVRVRPLRAYDLGFRSRKRLALAATAQTPWGEVRVFNTHLDTRLNARDRLEQLEPVIRDGAAFKGPRIVGGDFNSNGFYWLFRMLPLPAMRAQTSYVQEFMSAAGFTSAVPLLQSTFDYLGMHLDWIWVRGGYAAHMSAAAK
jgi:endonuclease/exonuclease/phosphatase family metal-dependent hydrolase